MERVFGRRQNLVAVLIAGALFFTALGFFVATNVQKPSGSRAENLWVDGTGLTAGQRNVPSFAPIAQKMQGSIVRIVVQGKPQTTDTSQGQTPPTTTTPPPGTTPPTTQGPGGTTPSTGPDNGLPEGHPQLPPDFQQTSEGSGVVISKDGYILTNQHVIEGADSVKVYQLDGSQYNAKIVGGDARDDLALIKVEATKPLPVAPLGDSSAMQVGDWVMAMGNPLGFDYSATVGVVSGKARRLPSSNFANYLQTDAAIYPGNSGGPLVNLAGEVIAINTAVIPDTNLGFAVPINTAKEILPQLLDKGKVVRGYLGVSIQAVGDVPNPPKGATAGAVVMELHQGGPAAKAGIKAGDVIVGFNGKPVAGPDELTAAVAATAPDTRATVDVLREGKRLQIQVVVGSLPTALE
jgi:S1-C subfamily serine protease